MSDDESSNGKDAQQTKRGSFFGSSSSTPPVNKARSVSSPPSSVSAQKISRVLGPESLAEVGEEDEREQLAPIEEPTRDELRIVARISGAETVKDNGGEYVAYHVSIATGTTSGFCWKVARRFREFEQLHTALCAKFGADHLPTLPKKALRRNFDPEYIRHKKVELAKYLGDLVLDPQVVTCEPLAHFLIQNLQDLVRSNVENLRLCASRGKQVKSLEADLLSLERERRNRLNERQEWQTEQDFQHERIKTLEFQLKEEEEANRLLNNELTMLHQAWSDKFQDAVTLAKELKAEKKQAIKSVKDLDALTRRLKSEKKILVQEIKQNRAQLAALGALGHADGSAGGLVSVSGSGGTSQSASHAASGYATPSTGGGAAHSTQPQSPAFSSATSVSGPSFPRVPSSTPSVTGAGTETQTLQTQQPPFSHPGSQPSPSILPTPEPDESMRPDQFNIRMFPPGVGSQVAALASSLALEEAEDAALDAAFQPLSFDPLATAQRTRGMSRGDLSGQPTGSLPLGSSLSSSPPDRSNMSVHSNTYAPTSVHLR